MHDNDKSSMLYMYLVNKKYYKTSCLIDTHLIA